MSTRKAKGETMNDADNECAFCEWKGAELLNHVYTAHPERIRKLQRPTAEHEGARTPLRELERLAAIVKREYPSYGAGETLSLLATVDVVSAVLNTLAAEGPGEAERLPEFLFKHRFQCHGALNFCSCGNCPDSPDRDRDVWQWWSAHVEREWNAGAQVPPAPSEILRLQGIIDRERDELRKILHGEWGFGKTMDFHFTCLREHMAELEKFRGAAAPQPPATPTSCPICHSSTPCQHSHPTAAATPALLISDDACPHCGVPLTGMNSNPDECLHKPQEGPNLKLITLIASMHTKSDSQIEWEIEQMLDAVRKETIERCVREIRTGRTAVNFGHVPEVSRALDWLTEELRALATAPTQKDLGSQQD